MTTNNRFKIEHEEGSQWSLVDTANPNVVFGGGYWEEMQGWADELNAMNQEELDAELGRLFYRRNENENSSYRN